MPRSKNKKNSKRIRVAQLNNKPMGNPQSLVIPNELDVWLEFVFFTTLTAPSATSSTRRMRPTAAYDVDPTLGSTNTSGFAELAALYNYYRVPQYKYEIQVVNKEVYPIQAVVLNTNTDPGTGSIQQYVGNQYSQYTLLSGSQGGNCKHTFTGNFRTAQIAGTPSVEKDDQYASVVTTVPNNVTWLTLSVDSGTGGVFLTNGAAIFFRIWMMCRFYERKVVSS